MSDYNLKFNDLKEGQYYDMEGYNYNPATIKDGILWQVKKNDMGGNNWVMPRTYSKFRDHVFVAEDSSVLSNEKKTIYYQHGYRDGNLALAKTIIEYIESYLRKVERGEESIIEEE
jgi:hypothetical protein